MSYSKVDQLLPKPSLKEIMKKAQIPGVAIAYIDNKGKITTQEKGLDDGCGLVKVAADPRLLSFNDLGVGSKNAVILWDDVLFYVDQKAKTLQVIEQQANNEAPYLQLKNRCTENYTLAQGNDHALIYTLTGHPPPAPVNSNTVFGAASLSKPVFAYLVQKLIQANDEKTAEKGTGLFMPPVDVNRFHLDTPLCTILPLKDVRIKDVADFDASNEGAVAMAEGLTARMVLSHMTGLSHDGLAFQFNPKEKSHGYSNMGIIYLQQVMEKLTGSTLETLATKHVFDDLHMNHSTFIMDKTNPLDTCAANSLMTTAQDYALFVTAILHDELMQESFTPKVFMTEDKGKAGLIGVAKGNIPEEHLAHVAWGLGWGLQTNDDDEVTTAYHSGDMSHSRAWVTMNLKDKTALVYFANAHNGHVLAQHLIPPTIALNHAAPYFFAKWGFAKTVQELGENKNCWGMNPSLAPKPRMDVHSVPDENSIIEDTEQTEVNSPSPLETRLTPDNL